MKKGCEYCKKIDPKIEIHIYIDYIYMDIKMEYSKVYAAIIPVDTFHGRYRTRSRVERKKE